MTRSAVLALLLLAASAADASEIAKAAARANALRQTAAQATLSTGAAAREVHLTVRQSHQVEFAGATAAWAVDSDIVDVSAQAGTIFLLARAAGRTKVIVIAADREQSLEVVVAKIAAAADPRTRGARSGDGMAEVRYSSATGEVQNSVSVTRETAVRKTELQLRTVHQTRDALAERPQTSVSHVSYRIFTGRREITLFDRDVDHSVLTLANTPLRGVHYVDDAWRLHAGYTSWAAWQSFLIPVDRQLVAGAAYQIRLTDRSSVVPGIFAFGGEGAVASLVYAYDDRRALRVTGEVGFSGGLGAAAELVYDSQRDRVRAEFRHRPRGFAGAGTGSTSGSFGDASWSHQYSQGSSVGASMSASEVDSRRVLALSSDVEHRLTENLALNGGASWGTFDSQTSLTVPVGLRYDVPRFGVSALYRYAQSASNRGGHGFRIAARASAGRFHATAYADRQAQAPTLDLIFSERPDLALALAELGLTATSPADIARALQQHAALVELGFIEGITVDLAPMRTQFGFEASWMGTGPSRQRLRARMVRSVTESVSQRSASTIATLSWSRSLTPATDLFASYSLWRTERRGSEPHDQPFVEVGVRQRFDGLPSIGGGGTISGAVFVDENLDGRSDGTGVVAVIELDGVRNETTGADGTFRFPAVGPGLHRLIVRVRDRPEAYFTTPSRVEVESGQVVNFGIATTPARIQGRILSDAGNGIAGVRLLLARGGDQVVTTTGSDGSYALAAAPGEWQLTLLTDSVPAGYSLAGTDPRAVRLDRTAPREESFSLRAHRSITITGATPNAAFEVHPLGKTVTADASGKFSVRSLPAGTMTLVSNGVNRAVEVGREPSAVTIELASVATAVAAHTPEVRTRISGERRDTMRGYVVQLGAFRLRSNATAAVARASRSGVVATIAREGEFAVVRTAAYESREEAATTAHRLNRSGVEAVVMAGK